MGGRVKMSSFLPALKCVVVCFALAFFVFAGTAHAQTTCDTHTSGTTDKDALIALYCAAGGASWTTNTNWLSNMAISTWSGVTVDTNDSNKVVELKLNHYGLSGTIPLELGKLGSLQVLYLHKNELTALPPELGDLSNLQRLYLHKNELTALPPELGKLGSLQYLLLSDNQLTALPPELGDLSSLRVLWLNESELTALPPELGKLGSLQYLLLSDNQLTALPPELGDLSSLQLLYLHENELTGTIPPELGDLSSLQQLYLHENELTGTIPPELGKLGSLQQLYLHENELTGTIPPELGNLSNLERLFLYENQLTGAIPPELGDLSNLQQLWLNDNDFVMVPIELETLTNHALEELALWGNERLVWEMPRSNELAKRSDRTVLTDLHTRNNGRNWNTDNWFSPNLSDWHGVETDSDGRVIGLSLTNNNLTGEIPDSLRALDKLRRLELSKNKLSGAIPPELGNLTGLEVLDLSDNELSCDILDLSPLSQLSQLKLQNNYQLGGTLSESLADSLQLLNISCTSIPPGDWPDRIPDFVVDPAPEDCMGTVEAACPSPAVSPVVDPGDPGSPKSPEFSLFPGRSRRPGSRSRRPGSRSRRPGSRSDATY